MVLSRVKLRFQYNLLQGLSLFDIRLRVGEQILACFNYRVIFRDPEVADDVERVVEIQ